MNALNTLKKKKDDIEEKKKNFLNSNSLKKENEEKIEDKFKKKSYFKNIPKTEFFYYIIFMTLSYVIIDKQLCIKEIFSQNNYLEKTLFPHKISYKKNYLYSNEVIYDIIGTKFIELQYENSYHYLKNESNNIFNITKKIIPFSNLRISQKRFPINSENNSTSWKKKGDYLRDPFGENFTFKSENGIYK